MEEPRSLCTVRPLTDANDDDDDEGEEGVGGTDSRLSGRRLQSAASQSKHET